MGNFRQESDEVRFLLKIITLINRTDMERRRNGKSHVEDFTPVQEREKGEVVGVGGEDGDKYMNCTAA